MQYSFVPGGAHSPLKKLVLQGVLYGVFEITPYLECQFFLVLWHHRVFNNNNNINLFDMFDETLEPASY